MLVNKRQLITVDPQISLTTTPTGGQTTTPTARNKEKQRPHDPSKGERQPVSPMKIWVLAPEALGTKWTFLVNVGLVATRLFVGLAVSPLRSSS